MEGTRNRELKISVKNNVLGNKILNWLEDLLPNRIDLQYRNLSLLADMLVILGFRGVAKIYSAKIQNHPEILYIWVKKRKDKVSREKIIIGSTEIKGVDTPTISLVDRGELYQAHFFGKPHSEGFFLTCIPVFDEDLK